MNEGIVAQFFLTRCVLTVR